MRFSPPNSLAAAPGGLSPHYRLYQYCPGENDGLHPVGVKAPAQPAVAPSTDAYPLLLIHGLMGRARTWLDHLDWFAAAANRAGLGQVYLYDQPYHTGGPYPPELPAEAVVGQPRIFLDTLPDVSTLFFTQQLGRAIREVLAHSGARRVVLVGHSMGSLHAWCAAAHWSELVAGVVVEDMSPDFRGLSTVLYDDYYNSWPVTFDADTFGEMFGEVAGRYFRRSFDRHLSSSHASTVWTLHGYMEVYTAIANYWGDHPTWVEWNAVACPTLLLKAQDGVTQDGTMEQMEQRNSPALPLVYATTPGHIIHDVEPALYRRHVGAFLQQLT